MLDEDLDCFLEEHGSRCSVGGVDFIGIKDEPDEQLQIGMLGAQSAMTTLVVKATTIAALGIKSGVTILVGGVQYQARNPAKMDDGAFCQVPLTKVGP
jgi:hypothetical protein